MAFIEPLEFINFRHLNERPRKSSQTRCVAILGNEPEKAQPRLRGYVRGLLSHPYIFSLRGNKNSHRHTSSSRKIRNAWYQYCIHGPWRDCKSSPNRTSYFRNTDTG